MLSILITHTWINKEGRAKLWEVIDMFTTYIVVMVSWVYTYLQTHQVSYIKYAQLFVRQSYQ